MKYSFKITKYLAIFAGALILFNACKKVKVPEPMGDAGKTLVKIIDGGTPASITKKPVDFVPTPSKILAVELRRDVPNNAELQRTMIVTVKDDTTAVKTANAAYIQLPTAWYTIQYGSDGVKTGGQGGTFTFTFKPGEFSKEIYIVIPNATLLNPSSLYGLGFTIMTADAGGIVSAQKSVVVEIGAKNDWDGVYEMSGTFLDVSNPAFTYLQDQQYSLITNSATRCVVWNDDLGIPGYLFSNAGGATYYGSYGLVITFNPATGAVADLWNYYGDPSFPSNPGGNPGAGTGPPNYAASNTRRAVLDPTGVNAVQGNKDIIIKHWLVQPSVITTAPNLRSFFNETWKYLGPR